MSHLVMQQPAGVQPGYDEPMTDASLPLVARIVQDLIRFDTSNFGGGKARGEQPAADYIAEFLREQGLEPVVIGPQASVDGPARPSVIARWAGSDSSLPPLLLHGHTDVVPADPTHWSVDPFGGVIKDGYLWGRGSVDMKNMLGLILANLHDFTAQGIRPRRDVILAFFADEEAGGPQGAQWVVRHHPELMADAKVAISEVGGYSVQLPNGRRAYLVQTGEKGHTWIRLHASGTAGHASAWNRDNPVTKIARAVAAIGAYEWPIELTETTRTLLDRLRDLADLPESASPEEVLAQAGHATAFLSATIRNTSNPTVIDAGYAQNVIPASAEAKIDLRPLPGREDEVFAKLRELIGDEIDIEIIEQGIGYESPFAGEVIEAITKTLAEHDPEAAVLPYLLNAGTDNVSLSQLGITGYGWVPTKVDADFDFPGSYHAVDERIPLSALEFGQAALGDFLRRF